MHFQQHFKCSFVPPRRKKMGPEFFTGILFPNDITMESMYKKEGRKMKEQKEKNTPKDKKKKKYTPKDKKKKKYTKRQVKERKKRKRILDM